jgi:lipoprotein-releasing system permease protein
MNGFEAFIAHRYLSTRKKGAFVRIMVRFARWGTALGVFAMVVAMALMNGFREEIQATLFSATAHFSVYSVYGDVPDTAKMMETIRNVPGVVGVSPIRFERGLLKSTRTSSSMTTPPTEAVAVKAVDPATAHSTSSIFDSAQPVPVERLQPGEVIIGKDLADNLNLHPGDTVAVSFMRLELGLSGLQPKMMAFKVASIFNSRNSEYDKNWAFIHIADAQAVADSTEAEFIEVRTKGVDSIDAVKSSVLRRLNQDGHGGFLAQDLRDTNRSLFAALVFEKWLFTGLLSLIVLISAFNIISSLVLLVTEKRRDLGVLLSLGATPDQVKRLFVLQGLRIGSIGTAWGLGLSIPLCLVLDTYKIIRLPKALYDFITYVPFRLHILDVAVAIVFPVFVAWLAAWYPSRRAAMVDPVDALRAE